MLGKVLVLSASAGAGHVRAAQALERALAESGAAREVRTSTPSTTRPSSSAGSTAMDHGA